MIHKAKSEPAVSPVIGTILLVAIAVILVAIILVVVMGFSGDTNEKKVGLNAKPASGNDATLILYGGASIDELIRLEMIDQDSPNGVYVEFWNITNGSAYVGVPYLVKNVARPLDNLAVYDTKINIRGTFSDGTDLVLLIQPMTFEDVRMYNNNPYAISLTVTPNRIGTSGRYDNFDVHLPDYIGELVTIRMYVNGHSTWEAGVFGLHTNDYYVPEVTAGGTYSFRLAIPGNSRPSDLSDLLVVVVGTFSDGTTHELYREEHFSLL